MTWLLIGVSIHWKYIHFQAKNMEIPQKDLDEFKAIYKKSYGETLSDQEAQRIAGKIINLFKIIYRPIPKAGEKLEDDPYV